MKRVTTENTIWLFDEGKQAYQRLPRFHEGQDRSQYAWQGERLEDGKWIPFTEVRDGTDQHGPRLNIHTPHPQNVYGVFTGIIVEGQEDADWLVATYGPSN